MRPSRTLTLAALLAAPLLASCGTRPPPGLLPVASVPSGHPQVEIFAVTTRRQVEDQAELFGGERHASVSFARIAISLPKERKIGEVDWPTTSRPDPAVSFAATRVERLELAGFAAAVRDSARTRKHAMVFVHGYNTRFDEAAFRLAQIVHDAGSPVTPILFSWPSRGALSAYPYDRESAAFSRDALEELIARLAADPSVGSVSILAHSMGSWVTLEALRQMAIRKGRVPAKVTDVMLAAPDVDVDVAATLGRAMGPVKPRLTLFISRDDGALNISRRLWGSADRLGAIDPDDPRYRASLNRAGIEVVDLTKEGGDGALNHGKFASSPQAVRLIGARLASGQTLHRQHGLGDTAEQIGHGTGHAIGEVLKTPLKIISPDRNP
jgi:esterase/lipase superfamily enzyme